MQDQTICPVYDFYGPINDTWNMLGRFLVFIWEQVDFPEVVNKKDIRVKVRDVIKYGLSALTLDLSVRT